MKDFQPTHTLRLTSFAAGAIWMFCTLNALSLLAGRARIVAFVNGLNWDAPWFQFAAFAFVAWCLLGCLWVYRESGKE